MDLPDVTMSTADVIAARDGQDGNVASPDGPRGSRPKRRTFTPEYKMRMLEAYENAPTPQERNALLRREGLYSAYMTEWRRERDRAESALPRKRNPGARRKARPMPRTNGCGKRTSGSPKSSRRPRPPWKPWEKCKDMRVIPGGMWETADAQ